jgi:hypothetical protein
LASSVTAIRTAGLDGYSKPVNGSKYSWCAVFCLWLLTQVNAEKLWVNHRSVYCPYILSYAKAYKQYVDAKHIQRGDFVLFSWNRDSVASHIGFVIDVDENNVLTTIEGNTSDAVAKHVRADPTVILGAYRPKYTEDTAMSKTPYSPPKWAVDEKVIEWGTESSIFKPDPNSNLKLYWETPVDTLRLAALMQRFEKHLLARTATPKKEAKND